jgi:hypothetical protein
MVCAGMLARAPGLRIDLTGLPLGRGVCKKHFSGACRKLARSPGRRYLLLGEFKDK